MIPRKTFLFAACCLLAAIPAMAAGPADTDAAQAWSREHLGAGGVTPAPPFSFVYANRPSAELLPRWSFEHTAKTLDTNRTEHTCRYTNPDSKLEVRCVGVQYADFPAVEWVVYFKNNGAKDTPILKNVQALDDRFIAAGDGAVRLHHARGSRAEAPDFEPLESDLSQPLTIAPAGGRSSDTNMPFFNLALPGRKGVILAIGWTGQWSAGFEKAGKDAVKVRAGMEHTYLRLHPGEEIRTPAMLLLFWSGPDRIAGHNLLRRLLLAHYTPTPGGLPPKPPLAASPHGAIGFTDTTEANQIEGIQNIAAHALPFDTWWIDAGWHGTDGNWALNPGTWTPNPAHFPNGLKPVGDAAHAKGLRFLLWVEPERVMRGTWLYENHRDWLLAPAGLPTELQYQDKDGFYLLNLGNPEALAWAKTTFSDLIREAGIDIYRQDFNMTPSYFWRNGEAKDRQGMNEIRYVTGLYDFWDTLQKTFPGLLIDSCASGGRRIDFEVMRRALTLFRSDLCWETLAEQSMTHAISLWMPITGVGAVVTDPYAFRSGMGAHMSLALDYYNKPEVWPAAAEQMKQYLGVRHLFTADYHPLTPYSLEKDKWIAWQYDNPETGEGLVQAFRREECKEDSLKVVLQGLDPKAAYAVEDLDGAPAQTLTGEALMGAGLTLKRDAAPASVLLHYTKTK